jgi:hypothetical protein
MADVLGDTGTTLLRSHFNDYAPADVLYEEYGVSRIADKDKKSRRNYPKVRLTPPLLQSLIIAIRSVWSHSKVFRRKKRQFCG